MIKRFYGFELFVLLILFQFILIVPVFLEKHSFTF